MLGCCFETFGVMFVGVSAAVRVGCGAACLADYC